MRQLVLAFHTTFPLLVKSKLLLLLKDNWEVIVELNHKYGHRMCIGEDLFPTFMQEYNQQAGHDLSGPSFLKAVFDTLAINQELLDILASYDRKIFILSDNYRENIESLYPQLQAGLHFP